MAHPAESTHWYTRKGEPMYTVKAQAGHDRPTTLADARKLDLVPSVTTIINSAARPGLERWKANQLLLAGLTLPREDGETESAWLDRVYKDAQVQAEQARERGVSIHTELERWYADATPPVFHVEEVQGVIDLLAVRFPGEKWQAEVTFASSLGYGGKIDLSSEHVVLDFKTKEFGPNDDPTKFAWDEHAMQVGAYAVGIKPYEPMICGNVFVSTTNPGMVHLHLWTEDQLDRADRMFMALRNYWMAKNKYDCALLRDQQ